MKTLVVCLVLLGMLVAGMQIDDDLNQEALDLIKKIETKQESRAYPYLLGIDASEDKDPETMGLQLLNEYKKLEANPIYKMKEYSDNKKLPAPGGALFCKISDEDCWKILFTSNFNINSLQKEYAVLIARVNKFHKFDEYHTLAKPLTNEPYPLFHYIVSVERIHLLSAVAEYKKGHIEQAVLSLQMQTKKLRKALALQDNLVGKLTYLSILSQLIDAQSIMLARSGENLKVESIPALTLDEKILEMAAVREFGLMYYYFKTKPPEFVPKGLNIPNWITTLVFKPYMTINASTPLYTRCARLSKMPSESFAQEIEEGRPTLPTTSKYRNYMGYKFMQVYFHYDQYAARFMDFDSKLAIFNHLYNARAPLKTAKNPYGKDYYAYTLDKAACFIGPLEDTKGFRCLRTKI